MPLRYKQIHGNRDLSAICRLCVKHNKKNTSEILQIFTDSSKHNIQNEIRKVLQIQLFSGDGLPGSICKPCIEMLEFSSQFISGCVATDFLLRKVITFIYEASSLDSQMHNITKETFMIFELINGNGGMASLCRLCATQHTSHESKIFLYADNAFTMQIRRVICLQPIEGDSLPDSICISCASKLDAAHNFITKCVYGDNLLRNVFYEGTEIEDCITQEP